MQKILEEDIKNFALTFKLAERLIGKKFLVTGATGLIGSILVRCLLSLNKNIEITCPVRNKNKAKNILREETEKINLIECELGEFFINIPKGFDYIIHCASPTSGSYMMKHPVETYEFAFDSTKKILNYIKENSVKGMVYVSSLEYYGQILDDHIIMENTQGYIDMMNPRNSYPMGKRATEYLCTIYAQEYGVNVKIARLTQTFGAGISKDDNRVFAQFAKSVIGGNDIILHTTGESAKPYCYTTDCISAILYILLKGKNGEAYNVANPDTYISIRDMANLCLQFSPKNKIRIELHPEMGYAPTTKLHLSTDKLMNLGWSPNYNLTQMFERLIAWLK